MDSPNVTFWRSPFIILGVSGLSCNFYSNIHDDQAITCILVDSSHVLCWTIPFNILGVSDKFCHFYSNFLTKSLLVNNVDPDQMPHYVASNLGLHYLPMTLLLISR